MSKLVRMISLSFLMILITTSNVGCTNPFKKTTGKCYDSINNAIGREDVSDTSLLDLGIIIACKRNGNDPQATIDNLKSRKQFRVR